MWLNVQHELKKHKYARRKAVKKCNDALELLVLE